MFPGNITNVSYTKDLKLSLQLIHSKMEIFTLILNQTKHTCNCNHIINFTRNYTYINLFQIRDKS